jgi:hypothetical protein
MGGFAGGDEAGYWDDDAVATPFGQSDEKCLQRKPSIQISDSLYSIKALSHTISLVPYKCETFTLEESTKTLTSHMIYQAFQALIDFTDDSDISEFFSSYKVVITEDTSSSNNLQQKSLDAAAFILLVKEACNLVLNSDELREIGHSIDSDIAYFIDHFPLRSSDLKTK